MRAEVDGFACPENLANITDVKMFPPCNSQFVSPKQYVFEQRHGAGLFIVSNMKKGKFSEDAQEKSIQLLNAFGSDVTKLTIHFQMPKVEPLLGAVVANCHSNLIALKIDDCTADGSKDGLKSVRSFMKSLGTNFPKLQHLTIDNCRKSACPYWDEDMVKEMPSLTHLELNGKFQMDTLKEFLQSNRQIESLSVSGDSCSCSTRAAGAKNLWYEKLPSGLFKWLDETLPNLKHLYMNVALVKKLPPLHRDSNVYLKQLQTFVCEQFGDKCWQPNLESLSGDALEHLEINHYMDGKLMDSVAEKLERFVNLKQLTINTITDIKYYLATTWSSNGLRDFILSKPQLVKIVIRKRAKVNGQYYCAEVGGSKEDWLKPYREVVDVGLNGCKWDVRGGFFKIELLKINPK